MSQVYRLDITPGLPLTVPMSYKRAGVPTAVDNVKASIWNRRTGGTLVASLTSLFSSPSPGELLLLLPAEFTLTLLDKAETELWWDAYGIVAGIPVQVVAPSPVRVRVRNTLP